MKRFCIDFIFAFDFFYCFSLISSSAAKFPFPLPAVIWERGWRVLLKTLLPWRLPGFPKLCLSLPVLGLGLLQLSPSVLVGQVARQ